MSAHFLVQGSSRSQGNTHQVTHLIQTALQAPLADLNQLKIHQYTYEHAHVEDDFLPLMRQVVAHDICWLLTPVYWYSMSGLMKNFLDRFTDCLKVEKELGRKLRGKKLAAVACGSEAAETPGFFIPFEYSAAYLGMEYLGHLHTWVAGNVLSSEEQERIADFVRNIDRS
ncbi:MAG: NAD(P)H-dependent oxidoreductase [Bacteroidota bacterium]